MRTATVVGLPWDNMNLYAQLPNQAYPLRSHPSRAIVASPLVFINLSGSASGLGSSACQVVGLAALPGLASGAGGATFTPQVSIVLTGQSVGFGTISFVLVNQANLAVFVEGYGGLFGSIISRTVLTGQVVGISSAGAGALVYSNLSGLSTGSSTPMSVLQSRVVLIPHSSGGGGSVMPLLVYVVVGGTSAGHSDLEVTLGVLVSKIWVRVFAEVQHSTFTDGGFKVAKSWERIILKAPLFETVVLTTTNVDRTGSSEVVLVEKCWGLVILHAPAR